jgi:hypothetical protein
MEALLLLLVSVVAERPYDTEDMEGDNACDPACLHDGVCQNTICYCKSPYSGDSCDDELVVGPRLSIVLFIVLMLVFIGVGFFCAFCMKFLYDICCIRMPKAPDDTYDEWPPIEAKK